MSNEKMSQDEALAKRMSEMLKEQPSGEGYLIGVASKLRHEIIDPAVIAGSLKLLKAHRNALYDAMPTGVDLDAMDLLNIIQVHLGKVDASIESLENTLKPVEVLEAEKKKSPPERMKATAQEAEVIDEDTKS